MKNEPTELEKFQALQIEALTDALKQSQAENEILQSELNSIALTAYGLASMARIGKERIVKIVNDPKFQQPIPERKY